MNIRFLRLRSFAAVFGVIMVLATPATFARDLNSDVYGQLNFRHIGPEGNRVIAIAGNPGNRNVIYAGAASGGIWKTSDGGLNWDPIFDDTDVASIGALAVSISDPNVVWAGTGETNIRSMISIGNGIYKSTDAGKTWKHMGLREAGRIGRVVIHPENPDIVFAAAVGTAYGPQKERGVFRTVDGGESWAHVLFVGEDTGASDIAMDPANPRNLIAGMWPIDIKTWQRTSGGPNGGIFISHDGGDSWKRAGKGLPKPPTGKIAVAYAPSNPDRIYALIETDQYRFDGVLWRSDDGGDSWQLISRDQQYHTRPHYYTRLVVAPDNDNEVYFLATRLVRTLDGGLTSTILENAGPDHHDMWIDPALPDRILLANDGGVYTSQNRGGAWFHPNLPVAQMYHVAVDDLVPYFVYGNRQDGPTRRGPSNSLAGASWHSVGGGEAGWAIPDPFDNNIVWASNEQGVLTRYDLRTGHTIDVQVWPETPVGKSPRSLKYRWVWCYPVVVSRHRPGTLYVGSQYVHKTTDGGTTWQVISPDLTTDDESKQVDSGGLTFDNVGVDYGTTLFAIGESPLDPNVLWAGSNDGLVHVTRDGGESWTNVTVNIKGLPRWGTVSNIEASRFNLGSAYITVDLHQVDDRRPYVYRTSDFGASWTSITDGIPRSMLSYAHVVREDPERAGMLYLGTENSVYLSFDNGDSWLPLRNNLPPAPIHWLTVQENFGDLVLGTYGRGFWILDDLSPLRQLTDEVLSSDAHLFEPRPAYRLQRRSLPGEQVRGGPPTYAEDPPYGAPISYYLAEDADSEAVISIRDESGKTIRTFKSPAHAGINRVYWDLRHEDSPPIKLRTPPLGHPGVAFGPEGIRYNKEGWRELDVEGSGENGPLAVPGTYTVELEVGARGFSTSLDVMKDPTSAATEEDIRAQIDLALRIRDQVNLLTELGNSIEWIRKQIDDLEDLMRGHDNLGEVEAAAAAFDQKLIDLEREFYILRTTGATENLLRFPAGLFSHFKMLGHYVTTGDSRPTPSKYEVFDELSARLERHQERYGSLVTKDLDQFNILARSHGLAGVVTPPQN
jgi:photosystem II stability/assembly factor-like uncharacterized protein